MTKLVAVLVVMCSGATVALADGRVSGRLTDVNEQPVKDATVRIVGSGVEVEVTTDPTGRYSATVSTGGTYTVTFAFGKTRLSAHVDVPEGGAATLDSTMALGGEIIEVHGRKPLQEAKPKSDPLAIPRYSDQAVLEDRWAKAWLLLDVDARGIVTRLKFLKRPGYGLDDIAVKHGFGVTFDPQRDPNGVPSRSYVLWPLEWPSMGWLQSRELLPNRMPEFPPTYAEGSVAFDGVPLVDQNNPTGHNRVPATGRLWQGSYPPCAGGRTENLSSVHPTLRDCSVPDLDKDGLNEPWITRGADQPAPVVAEAAVLDPAKWRAQKIAAARAARTRTIVAASATGALFVATAVAYVKFTRYADRANADLASHELLPPGQLAADQRGQHNWEVATLGFAAGAMLGSALSLHYWSVSHGLTIQPDARGAQLSYAARF
jgi:hypothetical protein